MRKYIKQLMTESIDFEFTEMLAGNLKDNSVENRRRIARAYQAKIGQSLHEVIDRINSILEDTYE